MGQFNSVADLATVFKALQTRLDALERTKVTHGTGAPPAGATEPYVDDTNSKVYFKVGGVWKSATLT